MISSPKWIARLCIGFFLWFSIPYGIAKPADAIYPDAERIIVIGDIHGDYNRLVEALRLADIIDSKNRWIARKTHVVQLGDIPDRGPDTLKAIDLLRKLEKAAKRKASKLHILIGNHDAMNLYGDLRYTTEGEFAAFATEKSIELLEQLYEDEVQWIKENTPEDRWPAFGEDFKNEWFAQRPNGFLEHRLNWLPQGKIGKWILDHNAVLKVGDNLFVHGGIGPEYADHSIDELNTEVRNSLLDIENIDTSIARTEDGPLWYRGLIQNPENEEQAHLNTLLQMHRVKRIIVGHTPTNGVILPRFGTKVLAADVGLSSYYGNHMACLLIEGENLTAIHRKGRVRLPTNETPEAMLAYLIEVSKLEPRNKAVERRIAALRDEIGLENEVKTAN